MVLSYYKLHITDDAFFTRGSVYSVRDAADCWPHGMTCHAHMCAWPRERLLTVNMADSSCRWIQNSGRLLFFIPFLLLTSSLNGVTAAPEMGMWTITLLNVSVDDVYDENERRVQMLTASIRYQGIVSSWSTSCFYVAIIKTTSRNEWQMNVMTLLDGCQSY